MTGGCSREERPEPHGGEREPRKHGRGSERLDDQQGQNEQQTELAHRNAHRRDVAPAKRRHREQGEIEDAAAAHARPMTLPQRERHERHSARDQCRRNDRDCGIRSPCHPEDADAARLSPPSEFSALDQAEHDEPEADHTQQQAEQIEAALSRRLARFVDGEQHRDDECSAERKVHEKDPLPAEHRGDPPAEQRPERGHAGDHRAPHPERDCAVAPTERGVHTREGRRQNHRPADALHDPRGDQQCRCRRDRGEQTPDHERGDAHEKHPPSSDSVTHATGGEQQGCEHHGVDSVDPLRLAHRDSEVRNDCRQGDADDRSVKYDH